VKFAALKAPPWWLWPGWLLHLVSYTLPSAGDGGTHELRGYACALIAWECWFEPGELANAWQQGQSKDAIVRLLIGWFNVTNLVALTSPLVLAWPGRPSLPRWTALLCAVGVSHAIAFWLGLFTGEVMPMRVGFFVWTLSYAWLAVAAYALMRRQVVL
jgi:hypothetical protein